VVRDNLGHANISTTSIYLHAEDFFKRQQGGRITSFGPSVSVAQYPPPGFPVLLKVRDRRAIVHFDLMLLQHSDHCSRRK